MEERSAIWANAHERGISVLLTIEGEFSQSSSRRPNARMGYESLDLQSRVIQFRFLGITKPLNIPKFSSSEKKFGDPPDQITNMTPRQQIHVHIMKEGMDAMTV
jgi:hypothetical protein